MIDTNVNLLVVSAHAADFVWRSGGTMAKYIKNGANVSLVILSYGVRGESNDLWKQEGQTMESVKKARHAEVEQALMQLNIKNVEFWDLEDYKLEFTREHMERMVKKIREVRPHYIITHGPKDAFNPDHENVSKFVWEASVLSISNGVKIEGYPTAKQARIFGFEPHQTEICDFKPDVIIDITETYQQKEAAMQCFKAQKHLIAYYADRAKMRGNHARRCSGNSEYKYAESFSRFYPYVGGELV
ncbi:glcnac-pi de-n-acetylase [Lucifera butyrica]|uniref:Glcnac-pi de-n-acetylase n=1 Tax=Lucifera butyrica TaxID=1351585 RepID=A0A498RHE4_9FIRM|nr:PIG-L deacetylase family protein [Lucifera butyrica]VBB09533.1 glcnac-pi de-n-acetylase [Lucifera butyrica]